MNDVFCEYLNDFMVCYIDDILIFSKNMEDYKHHVHLILEKLQKVELYAKLKKCDFNQFEMEIFKVMSSLEMEFTWICLRFRP
jgi:hypothetical protein